MPNYAVIDLGSNSVRLVVFEVRNDKKRSYSYKDFRHLINNKSMAGLAAYVEDGVFTEAGVKRAASIRWSKILRQFDIVPCHTRNSLHDDDPARPAATRLGRAPAGTHRGPRRCRAGTPSTRMRTVAATPERITPAHRRHHRARAPSPRARTPPRPRTFAEFPASRPALPATRRRSTYVK